MNAPSNKAVAVAAVNIPALQMNEEELIKVLESSIYPGAKLESIKLALGYCKSNHLDPMTKPVHIVPMSVKVAGTRDKYEYRDVIMPGIELYRTKAARTGDYAGISEAVFGEDVADDTAIGITYPRWCSVTVYRLVDGEPRPFSSGKVFWKETYSTAGKDSVKPNAMWKKRPYGQIEKCAEAMALRRAFPELGAQPTVEEMEGKSLDTEQQRTAITGQADRLPDYPQETLDANMPDWTKRIQAGKATADRIIAMIEAKYTLTDEQKKKIADIKPAEPKSPETSAPPTLDVEKLAERLQNATDLDLLDADADLIKAVEGRQRRESLTATYRARRAELTQGE